MASDKYRHSGCRDCARLKRRVYLCELSREMEECIPAPDDMDSRIDDMMLRNPDKI